MTYLRYISVRIESGVMRFKTKGRYGSVKQPVMRANFVIEATEVANLSKAKLLEGRITIYLHHFSEMQEVELKDYLSSLKSLRYEVFQDVVSLEQNLVEFLSKILNRKLSEFTGLRKDFSPKHNKDVFIVTYEIW